MKFAALVIASAATCSFAFVTPASRVSSLSRTTFLKLTSVETKEDTSSSDPMFFASNSESPDEKASEEVSVVPSVYDRLGFTKDQIALGMDPEEILKYLGTKEDMVKRTVEDIKKFDEAKATGEVEKFMMDAEMINLAIEFEKRCEEVPGFREMVAKGPQTNIFDKAFPFILGGFALNWAKRNFIDPKLASGELVIPFLGGGGADNVVQDAATQAAGDIVSQAAAASEVVNQATDLM